jgi:hypothetical protein
VRGVSTALRNLANAARVLEGFVPLKNRKGTKVRDKRVRAKRNAGGGESFRPPSIFHPESQGTLMVGPLFVENNSETLVG